MKKIIMGITIVLLLTLGGVIAGAAGFRLSSEPSIQNQIKINGGVIRIDPTKGVYLHTNSSHHSVGIEQVYIDKIDGSLVVIRDTKDSIVTTSVTPDETLTKRGIAVGFSGGGKVSKVLFYKNGKQLKLNKKQDFNQVASPMSNIWFMVVSH